MKKVRNASAAGSTGDNAAARGGWRRQLLPPSFAGFRLADIPRDIVAGLTLAAIAVPEQMATARLGHFPPEVGFFAFVAGAIGFAIAGRSRHLSSGADSTITPIFAGGLALLAAAGTPDYAHLAILLALMVGLILVVAGSFRLGFIADLLSVPVTTGFLAGIAVHILVSQLPAVFGIGELTGPEPRRILALALAIPQVKLATVLIGFGVFALMVAFERIDTRIPGALIALLIASAGTAVLKPEGVALLGAVPSGLPEPVMPVGDPQAMLKLLPLALIIAVVIMVQTAATSRSFPDSQDAVPDVNRDFVGVGAGSIVAAVIGAFPVNASPPRTAIVAETGGRSQLASLVAAALLCALLVYGSGLLSIIPTAALAGVLLFVAARIIHLRRIVDILRRSAGEFFLVLATAAAIILLPIEQGVSIGIALSLLHGIWSITQARVVSFVRVPGTSIWWPAHPALRGESLPGVLVVGFAAPLSFLNADRFRRDVDHLLRASAEPVRLLVLEANGIIEIDYTAAQALATVIRRCHERNVDVAIARLESERAQAALVRFGLEPLLGPGHLTRSVEEAVRTLAAGPERPATRS